MQKNKVSLEIEKEGKRYEFLCTPDSQLGEIYDVLKQMSHHVVSVMNKVEEMNQEKQKEEVKDGVE